MAERKFYEFPTRDYAPESSTGAALLVGALLTQRIGKIETASYQNEEGYNRRIDVYANSQIVAVMQATRTNDGRVFFRVSFHEFSGKTETENMVRDLERIADSFGKLKKAPIE